MTKIEFWERAYLAGLNAGRPLDQAKKTADSAMATWEETTNLMRRDRVQMLSEDKASAASGLAAAALATAPAKRGRPPKAAPAPDGVDAAMSEPDA